MMQPMPAMARGRAAAARPGARRLADLPPELVARILVHLDGTVRDLAAANAASRLFRGAPGERSPVEHVLRERARARGHDRALPPTLPAGVGTWTEELFAHERVMVLAHAHSPPVAAGYGFSAFVDAEGGLHTCGEEAVLDDETGLTGEFEVHRAIGHSDARGAVLVPTHVASLAAVRVRSVAAGWSHLLALSEAGAVYGCGYNGSGQLGLGDREERRSFALAGLPASAHAVCIAAGWSHTLALTAAGCAYSWGDNEHGQLGHGDTEDRWEPTRIEALDAVRVGGMAAAEEHTLLLSTHGAVYSCGHGYYGRLGHGDEQDQHTPRHIEALAGVRALHVSADHMHSLVVDAVGGVHSFGCGFGGQLGHGARDWGLLPGRIETLTGVRAVRASAGYCSSAVLGADGSVHTFGDNSYGQFGEGANGSEVPERVGALARARVLWCALGESHALFVTAKGNAYSCGKQSAALGLDVHGTEEMRPELERVVQLPPLAGTLR